MGSSTKRKPADRLRINRPLENGSGAGAAAGGAAPQDINNVCPMTLRSKLTREDIAVGTELTLVGNSLRLTANQDVEVGIASPPVFKTLETCLGIGIHYPTIRVVTDKQGIRYAEFAQ